MSNLVNKLATSLSQNLRLDGFLKPLPHVLAKQTLDHSNLILLGSRKDTASGMEKCSFNVGICFPMVESILDPGEEAGLRPTIGLPIHLLTKERIFHEWSLDARSFEAVHAEILVWIKQYAFPFFDAFNTIEAVVDRLSQEKASEWFTMTPIRRSEVLAASLFILHRKSEAMALLENQIEMNRDKLPKYRLPLQRLLQRLIGKTDSR
jgi:hypothetical protein